MILKTFCLILAIMCYHKNNIGNPGFFFNHILLVYVTLSMSKSCVLVHSVHDVSFKLLNI